MQKRDVALLTGGNSGIGFGAARALVRAGWREAPSSRDSYDAERARELWQASVRMTGLTPTESPIA